MTDPLTPPASPSLHHSVTLLSPRILVTITVYLVSVSRSNIYPIKTKTMASGENSNLVQEFEEAFQKCLTSLTEEDDLYHKDPEVKYPPVFSSTIIFLCSLSRKISMIK